jgi:anthranilate phosphoribosyltransferase
MSSEIVPLLWLLREGRDLSPDQADALFALLLDGDMTPEQTGATLMGLAAKGETVIEIVAAARAMRARMRKATAPQGAMDVCGTGGDGAQTLNISTAVAIVVAACAVPVAKHGNRAASSRSGATDVLTALGVDTARPQAVVEEGLRRVGIGYFAAPLYHPALAPLAPLRKSLAIRTIFNMLGPLCNPAGVTRQLVGVASAPALYADVLRQLGSAAFMVVLGDAGLDELSPSGANQLIWFDGQEQQTLSLAASDFGVAPAALESLRGGAPEENAQRLLQLLRGWQDGYRSAVLMNAGAALVLSGKARDWREGAALAAQAVDGGTALVTFEQWKAHGS